MVYGVDLGELRALNNLGPSMVVRPGDEILIQLGRAWRRRPLLPRR